ncbi:crossover junction endonuclease EME1B isoform X2 [Hevea brasiliensis]|uniref:crossover junction endonuclease EME1B isoform X2 n=1 Tax=Hevea brasiliensis TaxID=3981 RepID=UPI0025D805C6|nr:crossover junction endonuclease EME1B isoform X2 [Hevea brasiliensis]
MSNPIIISDDEDQKTPLPYLPKKPRTGPDPLPTILVLDDDPTPQKLRPASSSFSSTPSFVADTPMSDISIVKCTMGTSNPQIVVSNCDPKPSGNCGFMCLESENDESESESVMGNQKNTTMGNSDDEIEKTGWSSRLFASIDSLGDGNLAQASGDTSSQSIFLQGDINQVSSPDREDFSMEQMSRTVKPRTNVNSDKNSTKKVAGKKKMTKEERIRLTEEKKLKKEQEKLQKAALKAQTAELKKLEKEKQKWEKGKLALKSIVAEFDSKVVEQGSVGGHLLIRFAEKGLTYRITSNPIEKSIVWTMSVPEHILQLSPEGTEVRYVLLVYEAEEFCNLVINESLLDHVSRVQNCYPSYTICYLTNKLMAYINKRVHHRHCRDEAELAEHIVGLTCSLATCQYRNKLTRLSVNANGSLIPKDSIDKNFIKKSPWLKALVAIPKVQPRFAVAIWKKYPTMKSLLRVYMDPSISVHEKEFLLEDLTTEGLLGGERRVGQICSKRVYRILMAQSGSIRTDDVEDGADFFRHQSS